MDEERLGLNNDGSRAAKPLLKSTWDVFNSHVLGLGSDGSSQASSSNPESSSPSALGPALKPSKIFPAVTLTAEMAHLLHVYQSGVARWMDLFDHDTTYQHAIARHVLHSELLLHCACAFTAKHLSLLASGHIWKPVAERYYGESLRMLIELLGSSAPQTDALTATMLLCSYEMIAAQGGEHRRHFSGATVLITMHGINASSVGIDRANFWVYVRHEIVVALVNESSLLLNPQSWNVRWREGETREDILGNQVLWLLSRAINLTYGKDPQNGQPTGTVSERRDLIKEAAQWLDGLPAGFHGVRYGEETEEGFSKLYFAVPATGQSTKTMSMHILW